jgi:hypothetical protein
VLPSGPGQSSTVTLLASTPAPELLPLEVPPSPAPEELEEPDELDEPDEPDEPDEEVAPLDDDDAPEDVEPEPEDEVDPEPPPPSAHAHPPSALPSALQTW